MDCSDPFKIPYAPTILDWTGIVKIGQTNKVDF